MIRLPKISDKVTEHQAPYTKKGDHFIPDSEYRDFWEAIYLILVQSEIFEPPVRNTKKKINPYFGHFGMRSDLTDYQKQTYHTGIDIESRRKTNVYAMADGVLEHAGYGLINGKYIMLSHPEITTEDGYTLRTLYMHLHSFEVKFSSYQKMLREISLNTYPVVSVTKGQIVGFVGKTGQSDYPDAYTHLHIQAEFVNKEGKVIHIDPTRILGLEEEKNLTANIKNTKQFIDIYLKNRKDIFKRKLQDIWKAALEQKK